MNSIRVCCKFRNYDKSSQASTTFSMFITCFIFSQHWVLVSCVDINFRYDIFGISRYGTKVGNFKYQVQQIYSTIRLLAQQLSANAIYQSWQTIWQTKQFCLGNLLVQSGCDLRVIRGVRLPTSVTSGS